MANRTYSSASGDVADVDGSDRTYDLDFEASFTAASYPVAATTLTLALNQTIQLGISVSATIGALAAVPERHYPLTLVEITTP